MQSDLKYGPTTALVVVDMQNDFAHPEGSLFVSGGEEVVTQVNQQIHQATQADAVVVYTQDWHPTTTPHFAEFGGIWPVHCVRDTWGAQFHQDLTVKDDAIFIQKGTGQADGYSGFTVHDLGTNQLVKTELDELLRERNVTEVVVVGLATDYCVKATAIDAAELGYGTTVATNAIAAVNLEPTDGEAAIAQMADQGVAIE